MEEFREKAERLAARTGVSLERAQAALEQTGGDLLKAALLLERWGDVQSRPDGFYSTRPGAQRTAGGSASSAGRDRPESWQTKAGALAGAILDILRHCTVNRMEVWRGERQMTAVPVLILILLLVVAVWAIAPLLLIGLAAGCRYCFVGPELHAEQVNALLEEAGQALQEAVSRLWAEHEKRRQQRRRKR